MNKIVIIGSPGAGKSTLARKLSKILMIEAFHLDRYFWQPDWREKPREIKRHILQRLIQNERWIIEGTYLEFDTSDIRLEAADTIIFLNMPGWLCTWRVLSRNLKYHGKQRPDLPEGCPDKLRLHFILKVLSFPLVKRNKLYTTLRDFEHRKSIYVFNSKSEVESFLLREQGQLQEEYTQENAFILIVAGLSSLGI